MKYLIVIFSTIVTGIAWSQEPPSEPPLPRAPEEQPVDPYPEDPAQFPGGPAALKKFIADNLVYPELAMEQELEGICMLKFMVAEDGQISEIQVMRGVADCPDCDKQAVRLVKRMPNWIPGKTAGKPVKSPYSLHVVFQID
jgi:protein TonB